MNITVCILVQVPLEVQSLPETITSLRRLGAVALYDSSGQKEIEAIAARFGIPYAALEWHDNIAECFNVILADSSPASQRLLVHADEVVEEMGDLAGCIKEHAPGIVLIRHRITERQSYTEAREIRLVPAGEGYTFVGNYSPRLFYRGEPVRDESVPQLPLVLAHFPARWPGLPAQRISMIMRAIEKSLSEEPANAEHLYALLYRCWTVNDWPQVEELIPRWRAVADDRDAKHALVDYYEACAATIARDLARARQRVNAALAREQHFADAWYLLGKLRLVQRDRQGAREAFLRASSCGLQAEPVAVEDYSLSTWRPLLELARIAKAEGQETEAAQWQQKAEVAQAQLANG